MTSQVHGCELGLPGAPSMQLLAACSAGCGNIIVHRYIQRWDSRQLGLILGAAPRTGRAAKSIG